MEIKTVFDFNDFDKIKKYISPNYLFVHLLSMLVVLFCVLTNHVIVGFIIGFLGVAIMEGMYLVVSRKLVINFDDDNFTSHSINTNSKLTIPYSDIAKLLISDKYSFLITNANTFLIIETSQITENKLDEFLLSKNPNIKIK